MFFKDSSKASPQVATSRAFRHLVVFQVKLALDAVRDLALSPISLVVFAIDAIRKPEPKDSLYLRLMSVGRHSDRIINLFDEYSEEGHYTVDQTLAEVEEVLAREMNKERTKKLSADEAGPPQ
jgi:hypothetical protein